MAIPSAVLYGAGYVVLAAASVIAWRLGLRMNQSLLAVLWVLVVLMLPFRFLGMLVSSSQAVQPIHILMFVAALAGSVGPNPSLKHAVTVAAYLWGGGIFLAGFLFGGNLHTLWAGPLAVLYFMLDLSWFGSMFT